MKISIITPCLNAEASIRQCLASVAANFSDIKQGEHWVIDGGSTDATSSIVAHMPGAKLLSEPDRGQSDAMNKGIRLAQGDIIGFLNADDEYLPGAIGAAITLLDQLPEPSFVVGNCRVVDASGATMNVNRPRQLGLAELLSGAEPPWNPAAYFYHRSLHDLIGLYDLEDHYTMDLDFILRAAARIPLRYVDQDWGVFRWSEGAKTVEQFNAGKLEERKQAVYQRHWRSAPMALQLKALALRSLRHVKHRLRHKR